MPAAQKHGGPIDPAPEKERERLSQKGFLPDLETVTDEMSARLWQQGRRVPAERIREAFREHPLLCQQRPQSASHEPDRSIDFAKECERSREELQRHRSAKATSAHWMLIGM